MPMTNCMRKCQWGIRAQKGRRVPKAHMCQCARHHAKWLSSTLLFKPFCQLPGVCPSVRENWDSSFQKYTVHRKHIRAGPGAEMRSTTLLLLLGDPDRGTEPGRAANNCTTFFQRCETRKWSHLFDPWGTCRNKNSLDLSSGRRPTSKSEAFCVSTSRVGELQRRAKVDRT